MGCGGKSKHGLDPVKGVWTTFVGKLPWLAVRSLPLGARASCPRGGGTLPHRSNTSVLGTEMVRTEFHLVSAQPPTEDFGNFHLVAATESTLPDDRDAPARADQRQSVAFVYRCVGVEFALPEVSPRRWSRRVTAAVVSMPETTVDEADGLMTREYEVGLARKALVVQPVSETTRVKCTTQNHLGARVLASNTRHHP